MATPGEHDRSRLRALAHQLQPCLPVKRTPAAAGDPAIGLQSQITTFQSWSVLPASQKMAVEVRFGVKLWEGQLLAQGGLFWLARWPTIAILDGFCTCCARDFGAPLTFNASMPVRCPRRDRPDARFRQRAGSSFPERRCGPHVGWHARMHHRRRMAPERLHAAAAHCQLEDLQRIEEVERLGLTALDADRKCGPCARALPEIGGSFLSVGDRRQHLRHGGMLAQELRDSPRGRIGLFHPERQHLERPAQHPARVRFQLRADAAAQRQDPRLAQLAKSCVSLVVPTRQAQAPCRLPILRGISHARSKGVSGGCRRNVDC